MPPHLLRKLLESADAEVRQAAMRTLLTTTRLRGERMALAAFGAATVPGDSRRTVFDCQTSLVLSAATVVRTEDGTVSIDDSANRAFDGLGSTRDFYKTVLGRNSIDDSGMRLDAYVHFGEGYDNAFWDGQRMVFGDGGGSRFTDFTASLDVIGHELTHGVTEHAAGLVYHKQPGALNESISDVFGSLVKQWSLRQSADDADWLIGAEIFSPGVEADALRSMKAPGTAYNNPEFGKDPQPDHMERYRPLPDTEDGDNGGVHINSGIPNKAFYLTAIEIGGYAWEAPGHIWYEALKASSPTSQFQDFADTTFAKAGQLYGAASREQKAVGAAWQEVGIRIAGAAAQAAVDRTRAAVREGDSLAGLKRKIELLTAQVTALSKEVAGLRVGRAGGRAGRG